MAGPVSICCCDARCDVKILTASATRMGHPVLYTLSGGNGSLYHRTKTIDYTDLDYDYHLEISLVDDKTGKLSWLETSSLPGGSTLAQNRTRAITQINTHFAAWRTTASGTYTNITWSRTLNGVDIIGASYVDSSGPFETWSVVMDDIYTDTDLLELLDDLRRYQNAGSGIGIAGAAENSITTIRWNETDTRGYLAFVIPDATTLTGLDALDDPEIVLSVIDAESYWNAAGTWWQHLGGGMTNGEVDGEDDPFSVFDCVFEGDETMPAIGVSNDGLFNQQTMGVIRFYTNDPVCGEAEMEDNAGPADPFCVMTVGGGGVADWYSPDPISVSTKDFIRPTGNVAFTSPGTMGSDCPCTTAP